MQQQQEEQQRIQQRREQEQKETQSVLLDEKKNRKAEMPLSGPNVPEPEQETQDAEAEPSVDAEANEQQGTKSAAALPEESVLSDKIDEHEALRLKLIKLMVVLRKPSQTTNKVRPVSLRLLRQ